MKRGEKLILLVPLFLILCCWVGAAMGGDTGAEQPSRPASHHIFTDDTTRHPVSIALDEMEVKAFMDYVLGDLLGVNYIMDPAIKGTLSLHISGEFNRREFLDIVNTLLQMNGLALVNGANSIYKVVRKPAGIQFGGHVVTRGKWTPGDALNVIRLRYLMAEYAVKALRPMLSPGAFIAAEPSINAILISDTRENVSKLKQLLELMDVPVFKKVYWRLFTLKNSEVTELAEDLKKIFHEKSVYVPPGFDPDGIQFVPLKTINSVLVITRWEEVLELADTWIKKLDQGSLDQGIQVHVYFVQNGKAKDLAQILQQIYQGEAKDKRKSIIVRRTQTKKKQPKSTSIVSGELTNNVEIIPDEVNNALIIKANGRDYAIIARVIKQIDVLPREVLIDTLILEVSLKDQLEYGVEWYFSHNGISIDGKRYNADAALSDGTTIAPNTPLGEGLNGFSYSLFNSVGDLRALIRTIADKTDVDILSAPNILALDNQEAHIEAGDDVPTLTGTTTTTGGTVTQSVEYRNAGIILNVKPYINDNGLVRLEVSQEVSQVENETTGGITSPRFTTRKAKTTLVVRDGQTILMGGLMQTTRSRITTGIPFLKDLPLLGWIFGSRHYQTEKKELLIAITPHVIKTKAQADAMTREFLERVKSLKKMLEEQHMLKRFQKGPEVVSPSLAREVE